MISFSSYFKIQCIFREKARAINFKSRQFFYSIKLTDLNANHFNSSWVPHHQVKAWTKIKRHGYTHRYGFSVFSFFYLYCMTEHGNSFRKSIISSYELHSFFRYLVLKLEKLRQPVTKYIETTNFYKSLLWHFAREGSTKVCQDFWAREKVGHHS